MKKHLAILSTGALAAGLFALPASAHQGESGIIQVVTPAEGATVGSIFTVTVKVDTEVRCQLPSQIFLTSQESAQQPEALASFVIPSLPVYVQSNNPSYTYRVNTAEAYGFDPEGGSVPRVPPAGRYDVVVASDDEQCDYAFGHSGVFSLAYQTQPVAAPKAKPSVAPQVAQKVLATPSPSPSVAPVMATPTAEVKSDESEIDPMVALILGALLGAAILALAEVSAVEYRKKHGLKGDVTKRKK